MDIRKTWNFWFFIVLLGGLFILGYIGLEVLRGPLWMCVVCFLWGIVIPLYIIPRKCRCPECKYLFVAREHKELSVFTGYYWPSYISLRCKGCGQLLNEGGEKNLDPVIIDDAVMHSRLIHKVDPSYPESVKSTGASGAVVLTVTTNEEGVVVEIRRVSGNPIFVEAAAKAVTQWHYSPTLIDGKPVSVEFNVHLTFLSDGTVYTKSDEE